MALSLSDGVGEAGLDYDASQRHPEDFDINECMNKEHFRFSAPDEFNACIALNKEW